MMASIGRKILDAFIEVDTDDKPTPENEVLKKPTTSKIAETTNYTASPQVDNQKFKKYFQNLFSESNMVGPDYFEFSRMVEAMSSIPDEKSRFITAFAGLSVQGLDKNKLISTANEYLNILDKDAQNFNSTVDAALKEKVLAKKMEMEEKSKRIQQITQEVTDLNNKLMVLGNEIKDNEEKIKNSSGSYNLELGNMKNTIKQDIEKINQYIS